MDDLDATERWYVDGLGCKAGRRSPRALILDLGGHQLVAQLHRDQRQERQPGIYPRHFGLVFPRLNNWQMLLERARGMGLQFGVEPRCRFSGEVLEHQTFFLIDPSGNWLEFKHYTHQQAILGCIGEASVGDDVLR